MQVNPATIKPPAAESRPNIVLILFIVLVVSALIGAAWTVGSRIGPIIKGLFPAGLETHLGDSVAESVAWSPDGSYLAAGYLVGTRARIWDVAKGKVVQELDDFRGGVNLVSWSPDGKYLITVSGEPSNTFRIWDTATWQEVFVTDPVPNTKETTTDVTSLDWSPDGKQVAVGLATVTGAGIDYLRNIGAKSIIKIYDVPSGNEAATLEYPDIGGIGSVSWFPDGKRILFTAGYDGYSSYPKGIYVWDVTKGGGPSTASNTQPFKLEKSEDGVGSLEWSPDGAYLAGNLPDDTVRVWDASTLKLLHTFGTNASAGGPTWSPDGSRLAAPVSSINEEGLEVWDVASEKTVALFKASPMLHFIAWSPDGKNIASSSGMIAIGSIDIWGFEDASIVPVPTSTSAPINPKPGEMQVIGKHGDYGVVVAWSPDGFLLASGGGDNRARIWDAKSGALVSTLMVQDRVDALKWSPDGKYLLTLMSHEPNSIQVWDTSTWEIAKRLHMDGLIHSVDWSPDSRYLVLAQIIYEDQAPGWMVVLDTTDWSEAQRLPQFGFADKVDWSPDGKYIAISSATGGPNPSFQTWIVNASPWQTIHTFPDDAKEAVWSPNSKILAINKADKQLELWDVASQTTRGALPLEKAPGFITWSPDSKRLLFNVQFDQSPLLIYDVANLQLADRYDLHEGIFSADVSPDGSLVALGGWIPDIRILKLK